MEQESVAANVMVAIEKALGDYNDDFGSSTESTAGSVVESKVESESQEDVSTRVAHRSVFSGSGRIWPDPTTHRIEGTWPDSDRNTCRAPTECFSDWSNRVRIGCSGWAFFGPSVLGIFYQTKLIFGPFGPSLCWAFFTKQN